MEQISIEDFKKVEIRIGEIISAEAIPGSEKLLKLKVNFGPSPVAGDGPEHSEDQNVLKGEMDIRQILSGIAKHIAGEALIGVKCPFVLNLPPREMMGLTSEGMILAASKEDIFSLLKVESGIPVGTRVG